jgi:hypothetical protein
MMMGKKVPKRMKINSKNSNFRKVLTLAMHHNNQLKI